MLDPLRVTVNKSAEPQGAGKIWHPLIVPREWYVREQLIWQAMQPCTITIEVNGKRDLMKYAAVMQLVHKGASCGFVARLGQPGAASKFQNLHLLDVKRRGGTDIHISLGDLAWVRAHATTPEATCTSRCAATADSEAAAPRPSGGASPGNSDMGMAAAEACVMAGGAAEGGLVSGTSSEGTANAATGTASTEAGTSTDSRSHGDAASDGEGEKATGTSGSTRPRTSPAAAAAAGSGIKKHAATSFAVVSSSSTQCGCAFCPCHYDGADNAFGSSVDGAPYGSAAIADHQMSLSKSHPGSGRLHGAVAARPSARHLAPVAPAPASAAAAGSNGALSGHLSRDRLRDLCLPGMLRPNPHASGLAVRQEATEARGIRGASPAAGPGTLAAGVAEPAAAGQLIGRELVLPPELAAPRVAERHVLVQMEIDGELEDCKVQYRLAIVGGGGALALQGVSRPLRGLRLLSVEEAGEGDLLIRAETPAALPAAAPPPPLAPVMETHQLTLGRSASGRKRRPSLKAREGACSAAAPAAVPPLRPMHSAPAELPAAEGLLSAAQHLHLLQQQQLQQQQLLQQQKRRGRPPRSRPAPPLLPAWQERSPSADAEHDDAEESMEQAAGSLDAMEDLDSNVPKPATKRSRTAVAGPAADVTAGRAGVRATADPRIRSALQPLAAARRVAATSALLVADVALGVAPAVAAANDAATGAAGKAETPDVGAHTEDDENGAGADIEDEAQAVAQPARPASVDGGRNTLAGHKRAAATAAAAAIAGAAAAGKRPNLAQPPQRRSAGGQFSGSASGQEPPVDADNGEQGQGHQEQRGQAGKGSGPASGVPRSSNAKSGRPRQTRRRQQQPPSSSSSSSSSSSDEGSDRDHNGNDDEEDPAANGEGAAAAATPTGDEEGDGAAAAPAAARPPPQQRGKARQRSGVNKSKSKPIRHPSKITNVVRNAGAILLMIGRTPMVYEKQLRSTFGNNPDTSKALRLLEEQGRVIRGGLGYRMHPYNYTLTPAGIEEYERQLREQGPSYAFALTMGVQLPAAEIAAAAAEVAAAAAAAAGGAAGGAAEGDASGGEDAGGDQAMEDAGGAAQAAAAAALPAAGQSPAEQAASAAASGAGAKLSASRALAPGSAAGSPSKPLANLALGSPRPLPPFPDGGLPLFAGSMPVLAPTDMRNGASAAAAATAVTTSSPARAAQGAAAADASVSERNSGSSSPELQPAADGSVAALAAAWDGAAAAVSPHLAAMPPALPAVGGAAELPPPSSPTAAAPSPVAAPVQVLPNALALPMMLPAAAPAAPGQGADSAAAAAAPPPQQQAHPMFAYPVAYHMPYQQAYPQAPAQDAAKASQDAAGGAGQPAGAQVPYANPYAMYGYVATPFGYMPYPMYNAYAAAAAAAAAGSGSAAGNAMLPYMQLPPGVPGATAMPPLAAAQLLPQQEPQQVGEVIKQECMPPGMYPGPAFVPPFVFPAAASQPAPAAVDAGAGAPTAPQP